MGRGRHGLMPLAGFSFPRRHRPSVAATCSRFLQDHRPGLHRRGPSPADESPLASVVVHRRGPLPVAAAESDKESLPVASPVVDQTATDAYRHLLEQSNTLRRYPLRTQPSFSSSHLVTNSACPPTVRPTPARQVTEI